MTLLQDSYDVALLDLDGVVYIGEHAVPHAAEALQAARVAGMRLAFLTNNAARPPEVVAAHLVDLGVDASAAEVVTSAQAAARLLADQLPPGSRVLVVGGDGLNAALRERDLVPVRRLDDDPAAVVQGFHPDVGWRLLAEGSYAVASGLPWVASNLDRTVPTARGRAPGNGTLVDAVRAATGREPVVAGKPEPPMHHEAVLRTGADRPLMAGDRLDTDIEGANRVGVDSLLVLTGVTAPVDLVLAAPELRPTYVGRDLRALQHPPESHAVAVGASRFGRWAAEYDAGELRLRRTDGSVPGGAGANANHGTLAGAGIDATDDGLDALRALCGAAWAVHTVDESSARTALAAAGWK